jgi:hypothetical protein
MRIEEIKQAYANWKNAMIKGDLPVLENLYRKFFVDEPPGYNKQ